MFDLRIKQAEVAFADGRLDEAYELVLGDGAAEHRRGKKLVGRLGRAFAERGNTHLLAERLDHALNDCNKAEKLNGNTDEVAGLRKAICVAIEARRSVEVKRNARLAAARNNIDQGWVSVGQEMLEDDESSSDDAVIKQDARVQRARLEAAIKKIEDAVGRGDIEAAVDVVCQTGLLDKVGGKAGEIVWQVRGKLSELIRECVESGRLDRAEHLIRRLDKLGDCAESSQWSKIIDLCRQVRRCVEGAEPGKAVEVLGRLKLMLGGAKWVEQARSNAEKYAEAVKSLKGGPLGLIGFSGAGYKAQEQKEEVQQAEQSDEEVLSISPKDAGLGAVVQDRRKFMMQIDGVGCYLVVCGDRVTVGPISSAHKVDVGLVAGPDLPVIRIERAEGDYFVRSDRRILVNEEQFTEKLLVDGDRVGLTMRCRMKFKRPNAASGTAMLLPSSAKMPRADVTGVILMDREILLGNDSTCHICSDQISERMAFVMRDGKLLCSSGASVLVDGKAVDAGQGLVMDKPIRIGRLGVVLTEVKD